jgi:hypothetical protein
MKSSDDLTALIDAFAKGRGLYRLTGPITLSSKGRLPRYATWREHPFIGDEDLQLQSAFKGDRDVIIVAAPHEIRDDLSHIRIPLTAALDNLRSFQKDLQDYLDSKDVGDIIVARRAAEEQALAERYGVLGTSINHEEFGSW